MCLHEVQILLIGTTWFIYCIYSYFTCMYFKILLKSIEQVTSFIECKFYLSIFKLYLMYKN